ncbi:uncharacterized protein PAC_19326 [Phialocephala subalpina]|uniref:Uncharacterized protein n=1 Tax=Phialocephala subalpina TaxID=576137 RepID=A0A1L7XWM5_9HELO|nr:uncharacterized protein PAC_19326 [Phialocephala subalpina]
MSDEKEQLLGEVVKVDTPRKSVEIDDLLEFSPYRDNPEEHATENDKGLPPLPQDDDEEEIPKSRRIVYKIVTSVVAVLLSLFVIFVVLNTLGFFREWRKEHGHKTKTKPRPSPSRDFALNFPEQYPNLDAKRTSAECQEAWSKLTDIRCHDAIWTRNWDEGVSKILGPSLDRFVPLICDTRCAPALEEAHKNVTAACSKEDVFDVEGYSGRFSTKFLESGPVEVMDVLVERQTRMCRKSPTGDAERGFCMTDMSSRWNIVDGIRSNGINGLHWFLSATKSRKVEPAGRHSGMQGSGGWGEKYNYWREERKFGPGRGETTCSWCTLNWFKEKLLLWEEGTQDSDGNVINLPAFLQMWENAGKRCAGDDFTKSYEAAVQGYIERGLLTADWETQVSGDIPYLMEHGPTSGDYPARDVDGLVERVKAYQNRTIRINPENPARVKHQALVTEYIGCLESFKLAAQDLQCYPFLTKENISKYMLVGIPTATKACSEQCLNSIDSFRRKVFTDCPSMRDYQQKLRPIGNGVASFISDMFLQESAIGLYETTCRTGDSWRRSGVPCAAIFKQFDKTQWAYQKPDVKDLVATTRRLITELPSMPQELKDWKWPGRKLTPEEEKINKEWSAWRTEMQQGVCSDCVWRRYVERGFWGSGLIPKGATKEVAAEWIKTVHLMRDECNDRGRQFQEQEVESVDKEWKKLYGEEAFNDAFEDDRQPPAPVESAPVVEHEDLRT